MSIKLWVKLKGINPLGVVFGKVLGILGNWLGPSDMCFFLAHCTNLIIIVLLQGNYVCVSRGGTRFGRSGFQWLISTWIMGQFTLRRVGREESEEHNFQTEICGIFSNILNMFQLALKKSELPQLRYKPLADDFVLLDVCPVSKQIPKSTKMEMTQLSGWLGVADSLPEWWVHCPCARWWNSTIPSTIPSVIRSSCSSGYFISITGGKELGERFDQQRASNPIFSSAPRNHLNIPRLYGCSLARSLVLSEKYHI